MLEGIDISQNQPTIDWTKLARDLNVNFVFVKATEGADKKDALFDQHWASAASANMPRGAYHMLRFNVDGKTQGNFFLSAANLKTGDLIPMVDLERKDPSTPELRQQILSDFLAVVEPHIGAKVILYVAQSFWNNEMGGTAAYAGNPLWVADWEQNPPRMPVGWQTWTIWQHTNKTLVSGIPTPVDGDRFNGDGQGLDSMCIGFARGRGGCRPF